jgi:hypothetical protein
MKIRATALLFIIALGLITSPKAQMPPSEFTLNLRTRDPQTGQLITSQLKIDPRQVGIVIVDAWNYHWCMTWTEQAGGMTPRMNQALAGARKLGMSVFWGPTDAASMFSGWPQRQRALAVPNLPVPRIRKADCRWTVQGGSCLCGPGIACVVNYGWDGMDPRLEIAANDLIVSGTQELYSLCRARGLTLLIYFGGATNICLTGKDVGLGPLYAAGMDTFFARDLAFAWTHYDPGQGYTPTQGNAQAADDLERAGIPTVVFVDELRKLNLWDDTRITEPVRITPAGTMQRPYLFEKTVTVTLEIPYVEKSAIHYTLDGTPVSDRSPRYERPLELTNTATLRTAAFRARQQVSLDGQACFILLPAPPPKPAVALETLPAVADQYTRNGPQYGVFIWHPHKNESYDGKPLRIRGRPYPTGLGMRAPAYARYDLQPAWARFVALAGVDDHLIDHDLGANLARYPSLVFKVFIDGQLAAESPVMRISQTPWRFDVPIPSGSRQIVLVCDDAGSRSPYDLGNWVEAGFLLRPGTVLETNRSAREANAGQPNQTPN